MAKFAIGGGAGGVLRLTDEIVTKASAVLGIRESGKTNTAKVIAEHLLALGRQVVITDPMDVWWGVKSSKDGKSAGYPVVVLGGQHADLPLLEGDGRVLADFVVDHPSVSVILSLRHLRKGAQKRFMLAFAEQVYFRKGQPGKSTATLFIIDEASTFVPQTMKGGFGDEARVEPQLVGAIEDWVRRGRSAGIGVMLIDQRAASLNKDVLTQVELLIAHRHTSPQDRKALQLWVQGHDTGDHEKEFMASLASLGQGQAWFWSPGWLDLFRLVGVDLGETFDSSATPKAGQALKGPKAVAPVDLEALKAQLSKTIETARANDPKELKAKIAELEKQIKLRLAATLAAPAPAKVETKIETRVERVEIPVFKHGEVAQLQAAITALSEIEAKYAAAGHVLDDAAATIYRALQAATNAAAARQAPAPPRVRTNSPSRPAAARSAPPVRTAPARAAAPEWLEDPIGKPPPRVTEPSDVPGADDAMTPTRQRIIDTLAWFESIGVQQARKAQLALLAGQSPTSSWYEKQLSTLKLSKMIDYPVPGLVQLTAAGRAAAHMPDSPPTTEMLQRQVLAKLTPTQATILKVLIDAYSEPLGKAELAERTGQSATSSWYEKQLSTLRTAGLIDYPAPGQVAALPVLFLD